MAKLKIIIPGDVLFALNPNFFLLIKKKEAIDAKPSDN